MRHRSADFWLSVGGGLFVLCLVVVAIAHHRYTSAETTYQHHLSAVRITPRGDVSTALNRYARTADHWLLFQTITAAIAMLIALGLIVLVVRRRNARLQTAFTS